MNTYFREIFEYHRFFNNLLAERIEEAGDALPQKATDLLCHIVNAQGIWNARILSESAGAVFDTYTMQEARKRNQRAYEKTLKILEDKDLEEVIRYQNSRGEWFENHIRDILFHAGNHSTHHRAQIATLLRQSGLEVPVMDYIFYIRDKK